MKKREVIEELYNYTVEPVRQEQIEKCIRHLPNVKRKNGAGMILKLQIYYIPKWIYVMALISYVVFALTAVNLDLYNMLYMSGVFVLGVSALLIGYGILSDSVDMQEIENSCKYCYANILFARIILIIGIIFVIDIATNIFVFSRFDESGILMNAMLLLPILTGSVGTMVVMNFLRFRGTTQIIGTYMGVSILADVAFFQLYDFMSSNYWIPVLLCVVCLATIIVLGRHIMERKFIYEAYNI